MKFSLSNPLKITLILLLACSLLAGCAAPAPTATPVPTIDQATLVAAAVKTIEAKMTDEAMRNPSPTPQPSATPIPPTATAQPPTETPTPAFTPTSTATKAPALSAEFLYAATYHENKREFVPNETFGLALGFKNNGTLAWEQGSRLKLISFEGEVTVQTEAELGKSIAPGAKAEFDMWAYGSETLGKHVWVFQLYTPQGYPVPGGVGVFSYTSK